MKNIIWKIVTGSVDYIDWENSLRTGRSGSHNEKWKEPNRETNIIVRRKSACSIWSYSWKNHNWKEGSTQLTQWMHDGDVGTFEQRLTAWSEIACLIERKRTCLLSVSRKHAPSRFMRLTAARNFPYLRNEECIWMNLNMRVVLLLLMMICLSSLCILTLMVLFWSRSPLNERTAFCACIGSLNSTKP